MTHPEYDHLFVSARGEEPSPEPSTEEPVTYTLTACESHGTPTLPLDWAHVQVLRNAIFWHIRNAATDEERESARLIEAWLDNEWMTCMKTDGVLLTSVKRVTTSDEEGA